MAILLSIYLRKMGKYVHKKPFTRIFIATLFIIAQRRNNLNVNQLKDKYDIST